LEFMRAVKGAEHREVKHAACFLRQFFPAPHGAPAIFRRQPLHRHIEIIRRRERLFDEVGTEHGLADAQAFVEQIVIHFLLLSCVNRNHLPQIPYVPSTSEYPFRSQRTPRNAKKSANGPHSLSSSVYLQFAFGFLCDLKGYSTLREGICVLCG